MDLVLFGAPGAGKGTQAKKLCAALKLLHVSTGDLMRSERASGSELGKKFSSYMETGSLVPDSLVGELLSKRLLCPDASHGAVFDGFPRTVPQAGTLDKVLGDQSRQVDRAILLDVPLDNVLERIEGRRVCLSCGHVYHVRYNPPPIDGKCVECGSPRIEKRADDKASVLRDRYEDYVEKTKPVIDLYRQKGLLDQVDGCGELSEVTRRIFEALGIETSGKS